MIWTLLLAAVPLDPVGAPLPLYVTLEDVVTHLRNAEPQLQACAAKEDETIALSMRFQPDGQVKVDPSKEAESEAQQCVRRAIEAQPGPVHHGSPLKVSSTVYFRAGMVVVSPSPTVDTRSIGPLMLFVDGDRVERDIIIEHLSGAGRNQE